MLLQTSPSGYTNTKQSRSEKVLMAAEAMLELLLKFTMLGLLTSISPSLKMIKLSCEITSSYIVYDKINSYGI